MKAKEVLVSVHNTDNYVFVSFTYVAKVEFQLLMCRVGFANA